MTDEPAQAKAPPGWYPHPSMAATQRYWDGQRWTDHIAPAGSTPPPSEPMDKQQSSQVIIALVLAGAVIGLILSLQSASLLTGTGTLWTGVAIAGGAAVVTWVVKGLPTWVRVVCVLAAVIGIVNVITVEAELEERRQEIDNLLD